MSDEVNALDLFVNKCLEESKIDYIGLWQIAQTTRERYGARTTAEVRKLSLEIVDRLYQKRVRPGNYRGGDFDYRPEEGCRAVLDHIEREWIRAGVDPDLAEPICKKR